MGLVAAIGTAVTAVAASVGVAVTATALTVGFTTIAAVGAVVGVIGQVTHNKVLSMVGLGLGAVGGIGALAAGAGLLGSGAGLLGEAPTTAAAADAAAAGTIDSVAGAADTFGAASTNPNFLAGVEAGTEAAGGAAEGGLGVGDVVKGLGSARQFLPEAASSNAPSDIGHATGSAGGNADTSADALNAAELTKRGLLNTASPIADVATPAAVTTAPLVPPPTAPGTGKWGDPNANQDFLTGEVAGSEAARNLGGGGGGAFGGILNFANKNPVVALGALQAAGSFLAGSTSSLTPAQVKLYESQAAANDQATALSKQQQQNLAAPKAVAYSAPVTGQAQLVPTPLRPTQPLIQAAQPAGFINQNPLAPQQGVAA